MALFFVENNIFSAPDQEIINSVPISLLYDWWSLIAGIIFESCDSLLNANYLFICFYKNKLNPFLTMRY